MRVESMHYRNRIQNSEFYFKDVKENHSSILPAVTPFFEFENGNGFLGYRDPADGKNYLLKVYPISVLAGGVELGQSETRGIYDFGLGAGVDFSLKKFSITGKALPYFNSGAFVRDSIQNSLDIDPGTNRSILNNGYFQGEFIMAYRPHRIFTFLGGYGKNFFGEGYRSLILSDHAGPNPFFKIETAFSSIKYVNLYQMWNDNSVNPLDFSLDRRKFAAQHYISWNITREFNLSIFETVIWQSNDTLINRGFDPNYLNPVVFYRPVEFGNGSADNVLLGTNMSFKFNKDQSIYTQFIIDDFLLAEIRARSRWWSNKYGFQFGYKSRKFLNVENLYGQVEFNVVRPFTFSHETSTQSYGHLNASVTHPIGANFFEVLGIFSYEKNDWRFTNKITYSSYGVDSSEVSYGQNVFVSYDFREGDYDHFIMQGLKKNVLNETFIIERPLISAIDMYLNFTYNWRMEYRQDGIQNNHTFLVGIRSRLWNQYTDF